MGLRRVILHPSNPVQKRSIRLARQYKAILAYLSDLAEGADNIKSMVEYCRDQSVSTRGVYKLMASDRMTALIDETVKREAGRGVAISTSKLVDMVRTDVDITVPHLVAAGAHLAKLQAGGYEPREQQGNQFNMQITLPPGLATAGVEEVKEIQAKVTDTFGKDLT